MEMYAQESVTLVANFRALVFARAVEFNVFRVSYRITISQVRKNDPHRPLERPGGGGSVSNMRAMVIRIGPSVLLATVPWPAEGIIKVTMKK